VNDADTKHLFDNRYGTGQSTIDGIIRATKLSPGRIEVRSRRLRLVRTWFGQPRSRRGAEVLVTEVDPTKALEAHMDGFRVMSMNERPGSGRILHRHRNKSVLTKEHFELMKDGAIISNSGHFNVEIDIVALEKIRRRSGPHATPSKNIRCATGARSTCSAKAPDQPGFRRRTPAIRHGHELCGPGSLRRVHGKELQESGEPGLQSPRRSRQAGRQTEAGVGRNQDRQADAEQEEYLAGWSEGT